MYFFFSVIQIFLFMFSDSYSKAKEKTKKAEYTSELNSNTNNNNKRDGIKKKFNKLKQHNSSSEETICDEDEFTELPTPPFMQREFQY